MINKLYKYFWFARFKLALLNQIIFHGLKGFHFSIYKDIESDLEWSLLYHDLYDQLTEDKNCEECSDLDL